MIQTSEERNLTDKSKKDTSDKPIDNQDVFVADILGQNPKIGRKLAESQVKLELLQQAITENDVANEDLSNQVAAWNETLQELSSHLFNDEESRSIYKSQVDEVRTLLTSPREVTYTGYGGEKRTIRKNYKEALYASIIDTSDQQVYLYYSDSSKGEDLAHQLTDEFLETAFTLNTIRVLDRVQKPLTTEGRINKVKSILEEKETDENYSELIANTDISQYYKEYRKQVREVELSGMDSKEKDERVEQLSKQFHDHVTPLIEQHAKPPENEEAIDIIDTKNQIQDIQNKAREIRQQGLGKEEETRQLQELDTQLINLLIPVANKVERLFPHQNSTNLTKVLENEEAICAGKVNIMLSLASYLGMNARANSVEKILDNSTYGHVCFECDLASDKKLVIDANFSNKTNLEGKSDQELINIILLRNPTIAEDEIAHTLLSFKRGIENAKLVNPDSRVTIYTLEPTGSLIANAKHQSQVEGNQFQTIRINPNTLQKEIWNASIPYPHQITAPDKDGYYSINSSFCNNVAQFIKDGYEDIGIYLFQKEIEMNPANVKAYIGLANLLPVEEKIPFYERVKIEAPLVYFEGIAQDMATVLVKLNRTDEALKIFKEIKANDESAFYSHLDNFLDIFYGPARSEEKPDQELMDKIQSVFSEAITNHPDMFFSNHMNIYRAVDNVYTDNKATIQQILETTKEKYPDMFWNPPQSYYQQPYKRLVDFYIYSSQDVTEMLTKLSGLVDEVKTKDESYFYSVIPRIADQLGDTDKPENLNYAEAILEKARSENPERFFSNQDGIFRLSRLYEKKGKSGDRLGLFQQAQNVLGDQFFTYEHSSSYIALANIYQKRGETDKAIEIYAKAETTDTNFWEDKYYELVDFYRQTGDIQKAIETAYKAKELSSKFFTSEASYNGYYQLANILIRESKLDETQTLLTEAQEKDPSFWKADTFYCPANLLARTYIGKNESQSAINVYQELKQKNPEDYWKSDYCNLYRLYKETGQQAEADEVLTSMVTFYKQLKDSGDMNYYYDTGFAKLATLYEDSGDLDNAISVILEAKANYEYIPMAERYHLASIYLKQGNTESARAVYLEAIQALKDAGYEQNIRLVLQEARSKGVDIPQ